LSACPSLPTRGPFEGLQLPRREGAVSSKAELVLRCSQPDAEVALDGVPQGTCDDYDGEPRALGLGRGSRRLEVKKRGFVTWESWLEADGTRVVVDVTLLSTGGSTP
jgi:hypothetical protein